MNANNDEGIIAFKCVSPKSWEVYKLFQCQRWPSVYDGSENNGNVLKIEKKKIS